MFLCIDSKLCWFAWFNRVLTIRINTNQHYFESTPVNTNQSKAVQFEVETVEAHEQAPPAPVSNELDQPSKQCLAMALLPTNLNRKREPLYAFMGDCLRRTPVSQVCLSQPEFAYAMEAIRSTCTTVCTSGSYFVCESYNRLFFGNVERHYSRIT